MVHFGLTGYTVEKAKSLRDIAAPKTLANFLNRKTQLYEQGADVRCIGEYVRNWWRSVRAGVEILPKDHMQHLVRTSIIMLEINEFNISLLFTPAIIGLLRNTYLSENLWNRTAFR
jgi:hypothetical protein